MAINKEVTAVAADGKLTAGELREFAAELEKAGVPDDAVISGRIAWGGAIKSLTTAKR